MQVASRSRSPAGRSTARREDGFVALLTLLVLVIGSLYLIVDGLNAAAAGATLHREDVTALALQQAKEALIARAAFDLNHPGSLPCPDRDNDGVADLLAGNNCFSYIGRLPWKTLGLPDLRDAERRTAVVRAVAELHRLARVRGELGHPGHLDRARHGADRGGRGDRVRAGHGRRGATARRPRGRVDRCALHLGHRRKLQGRQLSRGAEREHRHDLRAEPALRAPRLSRGRAVQRSADDHHARGPVRDRGAGRRETDRKRDRPRPHQRRGGQRLLRALGHGAIRATSGAGSSRSPHPTTTPGAPATTTSACIRRPTGCCR